MSTNYQTMAKSQSLMLQATKQRHPEIPDFLHRLSTSNFLLYLGHQSSRNGDDRTALFWLFQALKTECISPLSRSGFYRVLGKSLFNLLSQSWKHQDALDTPVRVEDTPYSENQLLSREVLVKMRRKKIELMVTIGNIFHRSISILVKRNQANIDRLPLS